MSITIRRATPHDVDFISWAVLEAIGGNFNNEVIMQHLSQLCRDSRTLYSWANAIMAIQDDQPVGCLICYDGAQYAQMRAATFPAIASFTGNDLSQMEMETEAGEFYLDSLAILPDFRGKGIGTMLLKAGIETARAFPVTRVGLVVAAHNGKAEKLYQSLGFCFQQEMFLFNENYKKLIRVVD